MRNLTDTMICWNPSGDVALFSWPDVASASGDFRRSHGACFDCVPKMDFEQRKMLVFTLAVVLIVRDGCDAQCVHEAFLELEEYVSALPNNMLPTELLEARMESQE